MYSIRSIHILVHICEGCLRSLVNIGEHGTHTQSTKLLRCLSTAVSETEKSRLRLISGLNTEDETTQPRVRPVRPETTEVPKIRASTRKMKQKVHKIDTTSLVE